MRARARAAGFTLAEVMIALAILALALTMLVRSIAGNISAAQESMFMGLAGDLGRGKMYDIEEHLAQEGFKDTEEHEEGKFDDEGWPAIEWEYRVIPVELPTLEKLLGLGQGSGSGSGSGSGAGTKPPSCGSIAIAITSAAASTAAAQSLASGSSRVAVPSRETTVSSARQRPSSPAAARSVTVRPSPSGAAIARPSCCSTALRTVALSGQPAGASQRSCSGSAAAGASESASRCAASMRERPRQRSSARVTWGRRRPAA